MPRRTVPAMRLPMTVHPVSRLSTSWLAQFSVLAVLVFGATEPVAAHPEDEFCVPGKPGIDPALCRAIGALEPGSIGAPDTVLGPLTDEAGNVRGFASTFRLYVSIGVGHILPGGLDHILFVLALCLAATRLRDLVVQISTFTVAHTVTLGLAAAGVIAPPSSVVEPFIAATIAFVAVENLVFGGMQRWRPLLVFAFGLVHGLGFAGFFGELGLPPGQFWSGLLGFNVGVEIGQLSVVLLAVLTLQLVRRSMARRSAEPERHLRLWIATPASAAIAATGLWWAVQRTFL